MRNAILWVSTPYLNNKIFEENDKWLNRDNCLAPFIKLKKKLSEKFEIDLVTQDLCSLEHASFVLYNDFVNHERLSLNLKDKSYLMLFESEVIKKENWVKANHNYFKKIFTWNDEFVDHSKYFKFNFSFDFAEMKRVQWEKKDQFAVLIAGNKIVEHPKQLYSERINARYVEKNKSPKLGSIEIR